MATTELVLSIVIAVRNRQEALGKLLDDLDADVGDHNGDVEVVVVDDASHPPFVMPSLTCLRPVLIRLPARRGANAARAAGFARSRGKAVHFHDSDDGLTPGWTDAVMRALERHPDADVLVTRRLDEVSGRHIPAEQPYFERFAANPTRIRRMLILRNCLGPLGGVIFARRVLEGVSFPGQPSAQDWALYTEVYARWRPIGATAADAVFIYRRDGADRISSSPRRKALGFAAMARRSRRRWYGPILRLHHLHQGRFWWAACRKRPIDEALRRTRYTRRIMHLIVVAYAVMVLGLR